MKAKNKADKLFDLDLFYERFGDIGLNALRFIAFWITGALVIYALLDLWDRR